MCKYVSFTENGFVLKDVELVDICYPFILPKVEEPDPQLYKYFFYTKKTVIVKVRNLAKFFYLKVDPVSRTVDLVSEDEIPTIFSFSMLKTFLKSFFKSDITTP